MENKNKKWLGRLALVFVIFHFTTIFVTALPETYTSKSTKVTTGYYVNPIFTQTWSMFAPCPIWEDKLKFKLHYENESTDWITPSEKNLKLHSNFKFLHFGDLVVGESNMLYWLRYDIFNMHLENKKNISNSKLAEFKKTLGYMILKKYLTGYSLNIKNKKPLSADIEISFKNVKTDELFTININNL
jgi:hypothetical protein